MTNEQLVCAIQGGDRDKLVELWHQVQRLIYKKAARLVGLNGTTIDDMLQSGFIAMMLAANDFDPSKGTKFTTHFDFRLRAEFSICTGYRAKSTWLDPLQTAVSLDAPVEDGEDATLADFIPDPEATDALDNLNIRIGVAEILSELPENQQRAVRDKYWNNISVDQKTLNLAMKRLRHPDCSKRLRAYL